MDLELKTKPLTKLSKLIFLALVFVGCRSTNIKLGEALVAPEYFESQIITPLTHEGENWGAHYSPDSTSLIYISQNRMKHKQPQVYEMTLASAAERRVTFQDGAIIYVNYDLSNSKDKTKILYSSTTDEIKENPDFIKAALEKRNPEPNLKLAAPLLNGFGEALPNAEIYSSTTDGSDILRLTDNSGHDGSFAVHPKKNELTFTSTRNDKRQLFALNKSNRSVIRTSNSADEESDPAWSPDGQSLLWTKWLPPQPITAEIWIKEKRSQPKRLFTDAGLQLEPRFHPNGEDILFTSNRDDKDNFEIYVGKKDGSCVRRLTYNSAWDRSPDVSPDGKTLIFTSRRSGKYQIYSTAYNPPPCPLPSSSLQSKGWFK